MQKTESQGATTNILSVKTNDTATPSPNSSKRQRAASHGASKIYLKEKQQRSEESDSVTRNTKNDDISVPSEGIERDEVDFSGNAFSPFVKTNETKQSASKTKRARSSSVVSNVTKDILRVFQKCNPEFKYNPNLNPRRVLTKDSKPCAKFAHDNASSDLILRVNDHLISGKNEGEIYQIVDLLGQGTFGQVAKCHIMPQKDKSFAEETPKEVAVKIIKNKPAYYNQALVEVRILNKLFNEGGKSRKRIVHLLDNFTFNNHLCLVFELLAINLYELVKQNKFQGLKMSFVKSFCAQILEGLQVLADLNIVHCDLKPENILLESPNSTRIKIIDFGSACYDQQTVYTYIQSRFYRAPEVILGLRYNKGIDLWSLGCIAMELFLGLPIFPGVSEHNQLARIIELLGYPPNWMLESGKNVAKFMNENVQYAQLLQQASPVMAPKQLRFNLKSAREWAKLQNLDAPEVTKRYFKEKTLYDVIHCCTQRNMPQEGSKGIQSELSERKSLLDFVSGLLQLDPRKRWTAWQASSHPFVSGVPFTKPYNPPPDPSVVQQQNQAATSRPIGIVNRRPSIQFYDGNGFHMFNGRPVGFSPRQTSHAMSPPSRPMHPYPLAHASQWDQTTAYPDFSPSNFILDERLAKANMQHQQSMQHRMTNSSAIPIQHAVNRTPNQYLQQYGSCPAHFGGSMYGNGQSILTQMTQREDQQRMQQQLNHATFHPEYVHPNPNQAVFSQGAMVDPQMHQQQIPQLPINGSVQFPLSPNTPQQQLNSPSSVFQFEMENQDSSSPSRLTHSINQQVHGRPRVNSECINPVTNGGMQVNQRRKSVHQPLLVDTSSNAYTGYGYPMQQSQFIMSPPQTMYGAHSYVQSPTMMKSINESFPDSMENRNSQMNDNNDCSPPSLQHWSPFMSPCSAPNVPVPTEMLPPNSVNPEEK